MKIKTFTAACAVALLAFSGVASAYEKGDWVVRGGLTNVSPDDSSSEVLVDGSGLNLGVTVDDNTQLGLNFVYFVTNKWNIELLAATPFEHDIGLSNGAELASTKHLPPSVTANYYFGSGNGNFKPYIGAGVNFTVFFDEEFTSANQAGGFSDLDLDSSWGLTAQVGADYEINQTWHINGSVRWIDIDTEATFDLGGGTGTVDVQIDPYVYTLSVGYKF